MLESKSFEQSPNAVGCEDDLRIVLVKTELSIIPYLIIKLKNA